jgi:hypothetical protein
VTDAVAVVAGGLVAGRYRLEELIPDRSALPVPGRGASRVGQLWQARDEVLARPVAVLVVQPGDPFAESVLAGARAVAGLPNANLAKVYDAGEGPDGVYVVTEYFTGDSLEQRLRAGPLEQTVAVDLVADIADAVAAAHRARVYGLTPSPTRVLFTESGAPRLAGVALADVAAPRRANGTAPAAEATGQSADAEARASGDTIALAHLLYAALTARWAGDPAVSALPAAPEIEGHVCTLRQVRGGVSREADLVVTQVLGDMHQRRGLPAITTPAAFAAALLPLRSLPDAGHPYDADTAPLPAVEAAERQRFWLGTRRRHRLGIAAGAAVICAALAGLFWPGETIYPHFVTHAEPNPTHSTSAAADGAPGQPLAASKVSEFDPYGDHTDPHVAEAPLAMDGDAGTAWHTQTFASARLGNMKPGVGLLVDLGKPQQVTSVKLSMLGNGTAVELLESSGSQPPESDKQMRPVARAAHAGANVTLHPAQPVTARYWLVWLTQLPDGGDGFRGGIAEMTFES